MGKNKKLPKRDSSHHGEKRGSSSGRGQSRGGSYERTRSRSSDRSSHRDDLADRSNRWDQHPAFNWNSTQRNSENGYQQYMPYPFFYHPMYYQNEYFQSDCMQPPPPMWPNYYHPSYSNQHQQGGSSSSNNIPSLFSMPPPPIGMFKSRTGTPQKVEEAKKIEEPPPPGSDAAREKERAAIAKRLQEFDKQPTAGSDKEKSASPKPSPKSLSKPTVSSVRKPSVPSKGSKPRDDKTLKRPATSSSSEVPRKRSSSNELNEDIAKRISAMGLDEIKALVNNPKSAKSQEILKALMNHYRELKGVELDKRRLLAPSAASASASLDAVFSNVDAIAIADLPQEIITQLENFLGCDIFPTAEPLQANEVAHSEPSSQAYDSVIELEAENGEVPEEAMQSNEKILDPEKILEELVYIDMRIQADICRKMDLYRQLHEIMVGPPQNGQEEVAVDSTSSPSVINLASPPPSQYSVLPTPEVSPSTEAAPESSNQRKKVDKTVGVKVGQTDKKKLSKVPKKVTTSDSERQSVQPKTSNRLVLKDKVALNIRNLNVEVYDMKVVAPSFVLIACNNHTIYGFDLLTSRRSHEFKGHVDVVTCLRPVRYRRGAIEEQIVCSGGLDEHLCIFGFNSQQCVSKYYVASPILCLEFLHDHINNTKILYAGLKNGMIQMYDVEKFAPKGTLDCGNRAITALLATKEGPLSVLLVAAEDKTICLRDANTGLYLRQYSYSFIATNFVLNGDIFYCQSTSNGVTSFDIKTGAYQGFLKTNCSVSRIAKCHNLLLVTLFSGAIRVYDMNTRLLVTEISGEGKLLRYVDVADENIVVAARVNDMFAMPFTPELKSALEC